MHKEWQPTEEMPPVNVHPAVAKRKKLRLVERQMGEEAAKEIVLDGVLHELQNCLQSIGMGVDLLQLGQPDALEYRTINLGIERASRLLREVQEYFFPPEPYLSIRNLGDILADAIHKAAKQGGEKNIRLRCPDSFPSFQYDWFTLSRVLERIFRCAYGLLSSEEGEIVVSVDAQNKQTRMFVEIKVGVRGVEELKIEGSNIFIPFWRVDDYQAGLGLVLARRAINARHGQLTFEKTSPCCAHFTLLLAALESVASGRAGREEGHACVE